MGVIIGTEYQCDRCGKVEMLENLSFALLSGIYPTKEPDGWYINGDKALCDRCFEMYEDFVKT